MGVCVILSNNPIFMPQTRRNLPLGCSKSGFEQARTASNSATAPSYPSTNHRQKLL